MSIFRTIKISWLRFRIFNRIYSLKNMDFYMDVSCVISWRKSMIHWSSMVHLPITIFHVLQYPWDFHDNRWFFMDNCAKSTREILSWIIWFASTGAIKKLLLRIPGAPMRFFECLLCTDLFLIHQLSKQKVNRLYFAGKLWFYRKLNKKLYQSTTQRSV